MGFALGGVGFALGNLLLARALSPAQFGTFTLFLALVQIGVTLGPIGLEGQVNRRPGGRVSANRPLLTSLVIGGFTAAAAWTLYRMDFGLIAALLISIIAGGAGRVASAIFQSRLKFAMALSLSQGLSVMLIAMGTLAAIMGGAELRFLGACVAGYYLISSAVGWGVLGRQRPAGQVEQHSFLEGLSLLGITAAALILMQLERLLTPRLLSLEDLATFAVVTTLVGSPLRMLQMGAGYTLLPRLSGASSQSERRELVRHEAAAILFMAAGGTLLILLAAPEIAHWMLAGKYQLSAALMLAALVSGVVKLADGFATTIVWALGSARQLAFLNWASWTCAVVGLAAAWFAARWGLIGLMYGVTFGWICRGTIAGTLAARLLTGSPVSRTLRAEPTAGVSS
jgi:O-antigen/teichoic acid export membrane protein